MEKEKDAAALNSLCKFAAILSVRFLQPSAEIHGGNGSLAFSSACAVCVTGIPAAAGSAAE
jgi:hypothetical protein